MNFLFELKSDRGLTSEPRIPRLSLGFILALAFLLTPHTTEASGLTRTPSNLGLVGYWSLNEGTSTTAGDYSGNGNNGVITGISVPPTLTSGWNSGKIGKGLALLNLGNYITVPDASSLDSTSAVTVSAWVKLNANSDTQFIVNKDGNYMLSVASGILRMQWWAGTTVRAVDVTMPTARIWHHVVGVVSGNDVSAVYVDGVLQGSTPYLLSNGVSQVLTNPLLIGSGFGGGFAGYIDEVRVFTRALSTTEVSNLYRSGSSIKRGVSNQNLLAYWPMNDGSGTIAGDVSGSGNPAPLTGAPSWVPGKLGGALRIDQSLVSQYGLTDNNINLSGSNFTIAGWVKADSFQASSPFITSIFGIEAGGSITALLRFGDTLQPNNRLQFVASVGASEVKLNSNTDLSTNTWYYVVGVFTPSSMKLYINGVLDTSQNPGGATNAVGRFGLGGSQINGRLINGYLDDVRVYNRELSGEEISALYNVKNHVVNVTDTTILTNGLVGYWPFDGKYMDWSTNKATDVSGNANTGQLQNMSTTTSPTVGKRGQALRFDGTDDFVDAGNNSILNNLTNNFTISAWIKPFTTGVSGAARILIFDGTTRGFSLRIEDVIGTNALQFVNLASGSVTTSDNVITMNQWQLVTATYSSGNGIIYVNGQSVASGAMGTILSNTGRVYIGKSSSVPSTQFNGVIDDVRVYNRVLSASEVLQLYNASK